jgi:hypothetical protein
MKQVKDPSTEAKTAPSELTPECALSFLLPLILLSPVWQRDLVASNSSGFFLLIHGTRNINQIG